MGLVSPAAVGRLAKRARVAVFFESIVRLPAFDRALYRVFIARADSGNHASTVQPIRVERREKLD
jgi:hypothetical protein